MFKGHVNLLFAAAVITICAQDLMAQHCPPIIESYLESIAIKRVNGEIGLEIDYRKSGGQSKDSYQAYILAYSQSDAEQIAALTPQDAIESKLVTILHSQRADRQLNGSYSIRWKTDAQSFVTSLLKDSRLSKNKIDDVGGYLSFNDRIRVAVFVPFLDDDKYSVVQGLPEYRHECNYGQKSALFYDTLPQIVSVHFGIVQGYELPKDKYHVEINGREPHRKDKEDTK